MLYVYLQYQQTINMATGHLFREDFSTILALLLGPAPQGRNTPIAMERSGDNLDDPIMGE